MKEDTSGFTNLMDQRQQTLLMLLMRRFWKSLQKIQRTMAAAFDQEKIIVLGRDRKKFETVQPGHRFDRDPPIGAALRHRRGDRIMRLGLIGVARWLRPCEQFVDQDAGAGPGIAVDHQAGGIGGIAQSDVNGSSRFTGGE